MDAILLAAGRGTRMAPIVTRTAKPMLPIADEPLLQRSIRQLARCGVDRVVVVAPPGGSTWTDHLATPTGCQVDIVEQREPKGTGHAVAVASEAVDGDALLIMGDAIIDDETIRRLIHGGGFLVAAAQVADPRRYGVLELAGDRLLGISEKPDRPTSDRVNAGLYRLPAAALADARSLRLSPRGELEFTDVLHAWAERGDVHVIDAEGWLDIGTPWDYLAANERALPARLNELFTARPDGGGGTIEQGVQIHGRAWVEAGARLRSGTYIEGDVWIGAGADIGPNAYLRGTTAIGPGCRVGAASEVKNSILLPGAKAPHHNYVGDSVLGHDANLGSGTKIANLKINGRNVLVDWDGVRIDTGRRKFGAVVGDGAKTGVNASLNPGSVMPAGARLAAGKQATGWIHAGL